MKIKFIIGTIAAFAIVTVLIYTFLPSFSGEKNLSVEEFRKKQDDYFRSEKSPIPKDEKFEGLKYFPYSEKYAVKARITILKENETFNLPTSTQKSREFRRFAYADFEIDGKECRLTVLQPTDDPDYFFLPFADATSGNETYGAGRYIEPDMRNLANVVIDFNRAYNPYCAYNKDYDCPIPPLENRLDVAIKAGEKSYK